MMEADQDGDGKLDFEEFKAMVANTDIAKQMVRVFFLQCIALLTAQSLDSGGYTSPHPPAHSNIPTDFSSEQTCGDPPHLL